MKKNIFLITRILKSSETEVEFRCDTISAQTYKRAEELSILEEKYGEHLYKENDYIAEIY